MFTKGPKSDFVLVLFFFNLYIFYRFILYIFSIWVIDLIFKMVYPGYLVTYNILFSNYLSLGLLYRYLIDLISFLPLFFDFFFHVSESLYIAF